MNLSDLKWFYKDKVLGMNTFYPTRFVFIYETTKTHAPLLTERLLEKQTQRMDFPKKLCLGYSRDAKLRPCFYQYPTGLKAYLEFVQKTHQCKGYTIPGSNSFGSHSLQVKDCRHP